MDERNVAAVSIGDSLQTGLDTLFGFLPNILGFLVILIIGFIVAKVVKAIVAKSLQKLGLDQKLRESDSQNYVEKVMPGASPSNGIATVVFYLVFAFFFFSAIGALKIPALTTFMNQVLSYLPNVIVAIVIFVVAAAIAGAIGGGIAKLMGDTPTGKVAASAVPTVVMVIAMFMILDQLKIAEQIVAITFAATMGALALGLALAFGLGGRPVAQKMLEGAYDATQANKDKIKADIASGRDRAKEQADEAKEKAQDDGTDGSDSRTTGSTRQPG